MRFLVPFLLLLALSRAQDTEVPIGQLSNVGGHDVAGEVFALNDRQLRIRGFTYDGEGPAAVFWVGKGDVSADGYIVPFLDSCAKESRLRRYDDETVELELPDGMTFADIDYVSVWCEAVGVNFGDTPVAPDLDAPALAEPKCSAATTDQADAQPDDDAPADAPADVEVRIGELSDVGGHDVAGEVFALNDRQLRIRGFTYDGEGPAATFWVGKGQVSADGSFVPFLESCAVEMKLPRFEGETVELELPDGMTLADIDYLSVWCESANSNFGDTPVVAADLEGVPTLETPKCSADGTGQAPTEEEPFPVRQGWNCEELTDKFQARWRIDDDNVQIELVGRVPEGDYMSFGVSGMDDRTNMSDSDIAIAYYLDGAPKAIDYHVTSRAPCTQGVGVCPDAVARDTPGQNNIDDVSGDTKGDLTRIEYTRPLAAEDAVRDRPISTDGDTFIVWALGTLNPTSLVPLAHARGDPSARAENTAFQFGREVSNECAVLIAGEKTEEVIPGFIRPTISETTEITARIGPNGGTRGVEGITEGPSWGFAWFMSPTGTTGEDVIIPAIAVERGKTYTFTVHGGEEGVDETFHPLYITDNEGGGFETKSPEDRAKETLYAGVTDIVRDEDGGITSYTATGTGSLCEVESNLEGDSAALEKWEDYAATLDVSCAEDEAVSSNAGTLEWTVPMDAPDLLYYQCITHPFLGYKLVVFNEGEIDQERLERESGGGELGQDEGEGEGDEGGGEEEEEEKSVCEAVFAGETRMFAGCQLGLEGGVDVFWTIREDDGEIDTLFRAPTNGGYVGFGWGYEQMVGSNAVVAFQGSDGEAMIGDYFLEAQDPEGVNPSNNLQISNEEAAIDGEFVLGTFTRKLMVEGSPTITKGETPAIWAVGAVPGSDGRLQQHDGAGRGRGTGTFDLSRTSGGFVADNGDRNFFIAHAVLMLVAWLALTPAAVVIMTHLKGYNPLAFQLHRGLNVTSAAVVVASYIMGVVNGSHTAKAHLALGTIAFIFVLLQVATGVLRPHKETPSRKPWYIQHAVLGHIALTIAIANALVGMRTTSVFDVSTGWYVAWGVLLGLYLSSHLLLFAFKSKLKPAPVSKTTENERSAA